jgi:hypothetical protein
MRKLPFICGLIVGVVFSCVVAGVLMLRAAFTHDSDPRYDLVAVSWGSHTNNDSLRIYQVQVAASDPTKKGSLVVSARICIGGGNYFHDLGPIGTASDMGDAAKRFGVISWQPDNLTIGGTDGVKTTLLRSELQKHR